MIEMLYVTSVDVSVPNGPGVNELQFIQAASRVMGDKAHFILPNPARDLPENFPRDSVEFIPRFRRGHPISWLRHQNQKSRAIENAARLHTPRYVVLRTGILPIAELQTRKNMPPYFLKTAGNGNFEAFDRSALRRLSKPLQHVLFSRLLKHSAGVDVVTDIHLRLLEENYPVIAGRVTVFDNAVDTKTFSPKDVRSLKTRLGLDRFTYLIGYVGNLADIRGGTQLLQSWQHIDEKNETGLVVVSGDGRGKEELEALAREKGLDDRFFFLGPVQMGEVGDYINMLDIGVSFRDNDGSSELKVRQYLACGTPVLVSSKVNAFVDAADVGITAPRDNVAAIGRAASEILSGKRCADRSQIRAFTLKTLSFDAMIQLRRKYWNAFEPEQ